VEKDLRNEVQESLVAAKAGKPLADSELTQVRNVYVLKRV